MLDPGKLRHRVRIEQLVRTIDDNGDAIEVWATLATVWAAIEPLSAREFVASQSVQSGVSARITIRYRSDVRPSMRLIHGSKVYQIEGVLSDKDSGLEYITLPCTEGVPNDSPAQEDIIIDGGGDPL